jgi:hypothetical protein
LRVFRRTTFDLPNHNYASHRIFESCVQALQSFLIANDVLKYTDTHVHTEICVCSASREFLPTPVKERRIIDRGIDICHSAPIPYATMNNRCVNAVSLECDPYGLAVFSSTSSGECVLDSYPSTPHLPFSPEVHADDSLSEHSADVFCGREVHSQNSKTSRTSDQFCTGGCHGKARWRKLLLEEWIGVCSNSWT